MQVKSLIVLVQNRLKNWFEFRGVDCQDYSGTHIVAVLQHTWLWFD